MSERKKIIYIGGSGLSATGVTAADAAASAGLIAVSGGADRTIVFTDTLEALIVTTLTADRVVVTHSTLTYSATPEIDFDTAGFQTCTLTGDVAPTTSNKAVGKSKTIRFIASGGTRAFTFPAWVFIGSAAPASLASGKTGILTLTCFGSADTDIVAAYAVQP